MNWIQRISIAGISIGILFMFVVIFWLIYPYPTTDIKDPIKIMNENDEIAIGEPILLELDISKPNNDTPEVNNFITCNDGNLVTLANIPVEFPAGDYTLEIDNYILPPKLAEGSVCQFNYVKTYKPNPIREYSETALSEEFTVVVR